MRNWDPQELPANTEWRQLYQLGLTKWAEAAASSDRPSLDKRDLGLMLMDEAARSISKHALGRSPSLEDTRLAMITALSGTLTYLLSSHPRDFAEGDMKRMRLRPLEALFTALLDVHENQTTAAWLCPRPGHHPKSFAYQMAFRTGCVRAYKLFMRSGLKAAEAMAEIAFCAQYVAPRLGISFGKHTLRNWVAAHNRTSDPDFLEDEARFRAAIDREIESRIEFHQQTGTGSPTPKEIEATICRRHADKFCMSLLWDEPFLLPQPYFPPRNDFLEADVPLRDLEPAAE